MRNPAREIANNVILGYDSTPWGVWEIKPPTYPRLSAREKLAWHSRVSAALMGLPGDSMLLCVSRPVEASAVVTRMMDGVDLEANPGWRDVCVRAFDALSQTHLYERGHYLVASLPNTRRSRAEAQMSSAMARAAQMFRLPPPPASRREIDTALALADDMGRMLAGLLGASRVATVGEAEIRYLYARAALRGAAEPTLSEFLGEPGQQGGAFPHLAAVADTVLFEGGDEDDEDRPANRRYIRIEAERGRSYQTSLTFASVPREWTYPDGRGESLARLGDLPFPLDWCVRVTPAANAAEQLAITSQIRKLSGQYEEYGGDLAGAPDSLAAAIDDLKEQRADLAAAPATPGLKVCFIVTIGAPDLGTLEERAARVRSLLEANDYAVPRPYGDQAALWGAGLPGAPKPPVCADYTHYMMPKSLAGTGPLAGDDLGDARGALLGLNLDARNTPVLFWAGSGPNLVDANGRPDPRSGSIGVFGKLGGGKSYLTKRVIVDTLAMGGRVILTDRTHMGEYVRLARVLGEDTQTITLGEGADVCLDPMRVFRTVEDRIRYSEGFLTLLTNTDPTAPEGAMLSDACRRVAEQGGRLADVVDVLRDDSETDDAFRMAARTVALKVQVFTRGALSKLVFGDGPPVRLDAAYSVFHAPHLDLPSRDDLLNSSEPLMPEQVFSKALLYLVTAVARDVAFSERHRFSLVVQDEGYVLSSSRQGQRLLDSILRDGRKHNASLLFGSHHPADLSAELRQLLGSWFLFRLDRLAAVDALRAMDIDPTDAAIDDIDEARRDVGQCLYRDLRGNLGLIQVLRAQTAELEAAFDTSLASAEAEAAEAAGHGRTRVAVRPGVRRRHRP